MPVTHCVTPGWSQIQHSANGVSSICIVDNIPGRGSSWHVGVNWEVSLLQLKKSAAESISTLERLNVYTHLAVNVY